MKDLLLFCFWFLLLYGIFHLVYWNLFRPVLLVRLRYRIFSARDRLRSLVMSGDVREDQVFSLLEKRCHNALVVIEHVNLLDLMSKRVEGVEKLKAERDWEIINKANKDVRDVFYQVFSSIIGAVFVNSPGLFLVIALGGFFIVFAAWFTKFRVLVHLWMRNAWGLTNSPNVC